MRTTVLLTLAAIAAGAWPSPASARPTPTQLCESAKLKAQATFAQCRLKADAAYAKSLDAAKRSDVYAKCEAKLEDAFAKAEAKAAKAGSTCPRTGDAGFIDTLLQSCTTAARNSTAGPYCGDGTVDPDETCDGDCPTCSPNAFSCYALSSGSAGTCDLVCNPPILGCSAATADACCPYQSSGQQCGAASDVDCSGAWTSQQFLGNLIVFDPCTVVRVYGIQPGASYLFTTCAPGTSGTTGDPVITSVADDIGRVYAAGNDDCDSPSAIPNLAGWNCSNQAGDKRAPCAPNNAGGLVAGADVSRLDVTVCGFNNSSGSAPFYIWFTGGSPNPG